MNPADLMALAASLKDGVLAAGISAHAVRQVAGACAAEVTADLERLSRQGWSPQQLALLVESVGKAKERQSDPAMLFDLVLSGPDLPGVPTSDTAAVVRTMIEAAEREVLLVGYAVHNGRRLFEPLVQRMRAVPSLRVRFCLDIPRRPTDTSLTSEIVRRFGIEFRTKHWPWPELPELFYDPRSLEPGAKGRSSLHAKCVIVDRRVALVTSANFTEAAQQRNIEAGVLIRHASFAERLTTYFDGLLGAGLLTPCMLR
jgi:hypothetical protein